MAELRGALPLEVAWDRGIDPDRGRAARAVRLWMMWIMGMMWIVWISRTFPARAARPRTDFPHSCVEKSVVGYRLKGRTRREKKQPGISKGPNDYGCSSIACSVELIPYHQARRRGFSGSPARAGSHRSFRGPVAPCPHIRDAVRRSSCAVARARSRATSPPAPRRSADPDSRTCHAGQQNPAAARGLPQASLLAPGNSAVSTFLVEDSPPLHKSRQALFGECASADVRRRRATGMADRRDSRRRGGARSGHSELRYGSGLGGCVAGGYRAGAC